MSSRAFLYCLALQLPLCRPPIKDPAVQRRDSSAKFISLNLVRRVISVTITFRDHTLFKRGLKVRLNARSSGQYTGLPLTFS
jgi:hypothetical protein